MPISRNYSVFEYMYRDAGNWKTQAVLLLAGFDEASDRKIRRCLEWGDMFVAEQVELPTLYARHWEETDSDPGELDHAFHEFVGMRAAKAEDIQSLAVAADLPSLLQRFHAASGRWNTLLSRNHLL